MDGIRGGGSVGPLIFKGGLDKIKDQIESGDCQKIYVKEKTVNGQTQWKIAIKTGSRIEAFKQATRAAFSGKKEPVKYDSLSNKLAQYYQGNQSKLFDQSEFKSLLRDAGANQKLMNHTAMGAAAKAGVTNVERLMTSYKDANLEDRQKLFDVLPANLKNDAQDFELGKLRKRDEPLTTESKTHLLAVMKMSVSLGERGSDTCLDCYKNLSFKDREELFKQLPNSTLKENALKFENAQLQTMKQEMDKAQGERDGYIRDHQNNMNPVEFSKLKTAATDLYNAHQAQSNAVDNMSSNGPWS